jgi:hypothetical protein
MNKVPAQLVNAALVSALLVLSSLLTCSEGLSADIGPLGKLPAGWVSIPLHGRDSAQGAYYDRQSGALVSYDLGRAAGRYVDSYSGAAVVARSSGVTGRLHYVLVEIANVREQEMEALRREIGEAFPRTEEPLDETMLAPEHSTALVVTIGAKRYSLNFTAAICTDTERHRVEELVLKQSRFDLNGQGEQRANSRHDLETITPGADLADIVQAWGVPAAIFRPDCSTFAVLYGAKSGNADVLCRLEFTRAGKLARKRTIHW